MTDAIALARHCFAGFRDALATGDGVLLADRVAEGVVFRGPAAAFDSGVPPIFVIDLMSPRAA